MPATPPPPGLTEEDFERIEAAVQETERGRWFLTEYARRIRETETNSLLGALGRIEQTLSWSEPHRLAAHIEAVRERLQDLAWRLRQTGANEVGAAVEAEAALLGSFSPFEAPRSIAPPREPDALKRPCAGQGAISLRLHSIGAMDEGAFAPAVPAAVLPPPPPPDPPNEDPRLEAFAALEGLSAQERLALFA